MELVKCFKSIKEYAFVASEYPVVITLEDHLTPDLQAKVAAVKFVFVFLLGFQVLMHLTLFIYLFIFWSQIPDGHSDIWRYTV